MNQIEIERKIGLCEEKYRQLLDQRHSLYESDIQISEESMFFFRITEVGKTPDDEKEKKQNNGVQQIFTALHAISAPFALFFIADGLDGYSLYVGTSAEHDRQLTKLLYATVPGIKFENKSEWSPFGQDIVLYSAERIVEENELKTNTFSGVLQGLPFKNEEDMGSLIDIAARGMRGRKWFFSVFSKPEHKSDSIKRRDAWAKEATVCSELQGASYSDSDTLHGTSYQKTYFLGKQYYDMVQAQYEHSVESVLCGEWLTTIRFGASTSSDADILGQILCTFGRESIAYPLETKKINREIDFGVILNEAESVLPGIKVPVFSSRLSSYDLAVICCMPQEDKHGVSIRDNVDFETSRRIEGEVKIGRILQNGSPLCKDYMIKLGDLNRHCLVVGLTGSGKTNTIKVLIGDIEKNKSIPFLIIEPAKKEYWELYKQGIEDLQVYTLGGVAENERTYCLNPFEPVTGTPLQTHIDSLYAAFKASFIMYTPMPYVLEKALYEVYSDYGWSLKSAYDGMRRCPTIEDLYYKIPDVVYAMGYDSRMQQDLIGSLQARINSLRLGTKGEILNVRRSFPIDRILDGHVIIELDDIGDEEAKAFIISLLLVQIMEYRKGQEDSQRETKHIMVIEEAHRLLKNVAAGTGESADPRGNAVEYFCNMLAELRSKGQAFIVADQIPSKLAPDLVKNTNTKIAHRMVSSDDREILGGSMHMSAEQVEALASLSQGTAAVYAEGDNRPKLVRPRFAGSDISPELQRITREKVIELTGVNSIQQTGDNCYSKIEKEPFCIRCSALCEHQPDDLFKYIAKDTFASFAAGIDPNTTGTMKLRETMHSIHKFIEENLPDLGAEERMRLEKCALFEVTEMWEITKSNKDKLLQAYLQSKNDGNR